jgi:uncharacterized LabA/DUF88 family protein
MSRVPDIILHIVCNQVVKVGHMERVISYIDGLNLYHGLKSLGHRRYKWLNPEALSRSLLDDSQELVQTKYFTSRISFPEEKVQRQSTYLDALATLPNFKILEGEFRPKSIICPDCGYSWQDAKEKRTDVNIAVQMILDALADKYDTALLISGDSDLVPAVLGIRYYLESKRVTVAFPPDRHSNELKAASSTSFGIYEQRIKQNLLPDVIRGAKDYPLRRPSAWR